MHGMRMAVQWWAWAWAWAQQWLTIQLRMQMPAKICSWQGGSACCNLRIFYISMSRNNPLYLSVVLCTLPLQSYLCLLKWMRCTTSKGVQYGQLQFNSFLCTPHISWLSILLGNPNTCRPTQPVWLYVRVWSACHDTHCMYGHLCNCAAVYIVLQLLQSVLQISDLHFVLCDQCCAV